MKRINLFLIALITLVSCNENIEVEMTNVLNATVNPGAIVSGLVDGSNDEFYTIDNTNEVSVGIIVYDALGAYVTENSTTTTNFYTKVNFAIPLDKGDYTVVTWACQNFTNSGSSVWTANETQSLNALYFEQQSNSLGYYSSGYNILGVSVESITFEKSLSETFSIESVGSLVNIAFYYNGAEASKTISYGAYKDNSSYYPKNEDVYYSYYTNGSLLWSNEFTPDFSYVGIDVGSFFYLPMSDIKWIWAGYDSSYNEVCSGSCTFSTEKGECKTVSVTLGTGQVDIIYNSKSQESGVGGLLQPSQTPQIYQVMSK